MIVLVRSCFGLTASEQAVVLLVGADPEPDDNVVLRHHAEGAVAGADAHRVDSVSASDTFEIQAGVARVVSKEGVRVPGLLFDVAG